MNALQAPLALVTGGCHRLGAAISARLARDGWALALHSSRDATPEPALAAVLTEAGTEWHGFAADFTDEAAVEAVLPTVCDAFGRVPDLIVHNAAIFGADEWTEMNWDSLMAHFAVNTAAPAILSRALAARAKAAGQQACIVAILDQRIDHPHGDQASYTVSKLALAGLVQMLARAGAPNLRAVGVAPGLTIATEDYDAAQLDALADAMPLGTLSRPEQIADAVAWVARSTAITGQVIYVDGGAHMESYSRDFVHMLKGK